MEIENIFTQLGEQGWNVITTFAEIFKFISETTISDALSFGAYPWTDAIVEWLVDILGLGDFTILSLLVGSGLTIIIVVTLVKWVIGIIT